MLQLYPVYLLWNRRKTLTGSPDATRANGTNEPCKSTEGGSLQCCPLVRIVPRSSIVSQLGKFEKKKHTSFLEMNLSAFDWILFCRHPDSQSTQTFIGENRNSTAHTHFKHRSDSM